MLNPVANHLHPSLRAFSPGGGTVGDGGGPELHQPPSFGLVLAAWGGLRQAAEVLPKQQPRAPTLGFNVKVGKRRKRRKPTAAAVRGGEAARN